MNPIYWSLILLAGGFLVVALELFIPSAGVLGIVAAILFISGIAVAFTQSMLAGTIALFVSALALPVVFVLMIKLWPSTPIGRRIMLGRVKQDEVLPFDQDNDPLKALVGKKGVAKTKMLPSGMVSIDGRAYDAVSDGFAIEPGQPVRVTEIRTRRIFVQPYDPQDDVAAEFADQPLLQQTLEDMGLESLGDPNPPTPPKD